MSQQPPETPADEPATKPSPAAAPEKRFRRMTVSTGFSDVPGRTCEVCGFEGFRWQTTCPQGHPLG